MIRKNYLLLNLLFLLAIPLTRSIFQIETSLFSVNVLINFVLQNDTRRGNKIAIKLLNFSSDSYVNVGKIVDDFYMKNPWWLVENEPYSWKINHHKSSLNKSHTMVIGLQRYSKEFDPELELIASTQYPKRCNIPLHADAAHFFREWGNAMHNFENSCDMSSNGHIFTPYIADAICDNTHYLDSSFCPSVNNKYLVAFIPNTNCTLPSILSSCNHSSCLPNGHYYSNASADGILVKDFQKVIKDYQISTGLSQERPKEHRMYFTAYCGDIYMQKVLTNHVRSYDARHIMFGYGGLLFRPNYHFRSLITHTMHSFMSNVSFPKHGTCVAVHIRRSDRAPKGPMGTYDVKEWCKNHKNDVNIADLGCDLDIPFGALTLQHYLNASNIVSRGVIKNLFVMTDDGPWLNREIAELTSNGKSSPWSIYVLHAPPNHRTVSLDNGINFLTSLEIARHCSALVGHSRSAVTNALHKLMCFRHGKMLGRCPPLYDFGTTHW